MGEMENPGALAGASGAGNSELAFKSNRYRLRAERATSHCLAIADCEPEDAAPLARRLVLGFGLAAPVAGALAGLITGGRADD